MVGWWHTVAGEVHGLQRSTEPAAADPGGKGARRWFGMRCCGGRSSCNEISLSCERRWQRVSSLRWRVIACCSLQVDLLGGCDGIVQSSGVETGWRGGVQSSDVETELADGSAGGGSGGHREWQRLDSCAVDLGEDRHRPSPRLCVEGEVERRRGQLAASRWWCRRKPLVFFFLVRSTSQEVLPCLS